MSAVHVAIARLALEKSVHILYCSSSAFLSGSTDNFEETGKTNLCFCQGPEKGSTVGCDNSNCKWFYLSS